MRKSVAVIIAAAMLVGLTGCGNYATTEKEVREQAKFVKVCNDAGGKVFRGLWDSKMYCNVKGDN